MGSDCDLIAAECLDGVGLELCLGDVYTVLLLQGDGDLLGGDAAEQPSAGAGLGLDVDRHVLQLAGECDGGLSGPLFTLLPRLLLQLHGVDVVGSGSHRQLFGQEEVPGVAVGYLYHLTLFALAPDILL